MLNIQSIGNNLHKIWIVFSPYKGLILSKIEFFQSFLPRSLAENYFWFVPQFETFMNLCRSTSGNK